MAIKKRSMACSDLGESIPYMTAHAVSVSLPTWASNVGYEEGEEWVMQKMKCGYPRFFIHEAISHLAKIVTEMFGRYGEIAMLFPSEKVAERCRSFLLCQISELNSCELRVINLVPSASAPQFRIFALLYPEKASKTTKAYWQHTGEGISSRRAEDFLSKSNRGLSIILWNEETRHKNNPRRYHGCQRNCTLEKKKLRPNEVVVRNTLTGSDEHCYYVEERFGRNLNKSNFNKAKAALRRRISGCLAVENTFNGYSCTDENERKQAHARKVSEQDVYLYPTGMSSIFNTHRMLMQARGAQKSIIFGFPYVDTLKILQKFGPGCLFYGHGSEDELEDLQNRLRKGEQFLALYCEFPGNPLLKCPNLAKIRALADEYNFIVVIDETIGNFLNVNVLRFADIIVSSLTKVFSGDSNVMGGSTILNSSGRFYKSLARVWTVEYEDDIWPEDAIFLERNSRDFESRVRRINYSAELICNFLVNNSLVKEIHYPKYNSSKAYYDECRLPEGGYGGLLSITFREERHAAAFYDALELAKGPSLGTNFTLCCPYAILAHYDELDWAKAYGVDAGLIRISVGLEDPRTLIKAFEKALQNIR